MAIGAVLGSIASGFMTNAANAQMNANQIALTRELWEKEKKWNSPEEQVKRLRKAGANPAIAMNNGMLGSGETKAPTLPSMQPYDFSPIGQGIRDSIELYQQKRLQDSQIDNTNADTLTKNIRNKWEDMKIALEMLDLARQPGKTEAESEFLRAQASSILKELDWIDEKNSSMVALNRAEESAKLAEASYNNLRVEWQTIINQYAGQIEQAKLNELLGLASQAYAAARSSDADAELKKIEKKIRDVDHRVSSETAQALIDKARSEAKEAEANSISARKMAYGGRAGHELPLEGFSDNDKYNQRIFEDKYNGSRAYNKRNRRDLEHVR